MLAFQSIVPPQPINFRGVSISPTAIQLVWSPPELSHGMNILDYHLRCRSAGGTRPAPFQNAAVTPPLSISIPAKHTGYVVEGLQPDTLYQISLAARTKHGSGVATHVEIRTLSNGGVVVRLDAGPAEPATFASLSSDLLDNILTPGSGGEEERVP
nr:unnamed protein product [Spirometra erinaceieuropaei]